MSPPCDLEGDKRSSSVKRSRKLQQIGESRGASMIRYRRASRHLAMHSENDGSRLERERERGGGSRSRASISLIVILSATTSDIYRGPRNI